MRVLIKTQLLKDWILFWNYCITRFYVQKIYYISRFHCNGSRRYWDILIYLLHVSNKWYPVWFWRVLRGLKLEQSKNPFLIQVLKLYKKHLSESLTENLAENILYFSPYFRNCNIDYLVICLIKDRSITVAAQVLYQPLFEQTD